MRREGRKVGRPERRAAAHSPWLCCGSHLSRQGCPPAHSPAPPLLSPGTDSVSSSAGWGRPVALIPSLCQLVSHAALLTPGPGRSRRVRPAHPGPTHSMPGPPLAVTTADVPAHGQGSPGRGSLKELAALAHVAMARTQAMSLARPCCEHLAVGAPCLFTQKFKNRSSCGSILKF